MKQNTIQDTLDFRFTTIQTDENRASSVKVAPPELKWRWNPIWYDPIKELKFLNLETQRYKLE